jgi:hypothetical protein
MNVRWGDFLLVVTLVAAAATPALGQAATPAVGVARTSWGEALTVAGEQASRQRQAHHRHSGVTSNANDTVLFPEPGAPTISHPPAPLRSEIGGFPRLVTGG